MSVAALGLTSGPVLGIFLLGMLSTRVDRSAALFGFIAGLVGMVYLAVGQGQCTKAQPCTGLLALANVNEFVYTPILTVWTGMAAYGYALVAGGDPGDLQGLTLWSLAPAKEGARGSSGSDTEERLLQEEAVALTFDHD